MTETERKTTFCTQCGQEVGTAKFCPNCGAKVMAAPIGEASSIHETEPAPPAEPATIHEREAISASTTTAAFEGTVAAPTKAKKKGRWKWVAGGVLATMIVAALAVFFYYQPGTFSTQQISHIRESAEHRMDVLLKDYGYADNVEYEVALLDKGIDNNTKFCSGKFYEKSPLLCLRRKYTLQYTITTHDLDDVDRAAIVWLMEYFCGGSNYHEDAVDYNPDSYDDLFSSYDVHSSNAMKEVSDNFMGVDGLQTSFSWMASTDFCIDGVEYRYGQRSGELAEAGLESAVFAGDDGTEKVEITYSSIIVRLYERNAKDADNVRSSSKTSASHAPSVVEIIPPCVVRVPSSLHIYSGPGFDYADKGAIDQGSYTIVETSAGQGAEQWGKLKSGAGWIPLDNVLPVSN